MPCPRDSNVLKENESYCWQRDYSRETHSLRCTRTKGHDGFHHSHFFIEKTQKWSCGGRWK